MEKLKDEINKRVAWNHRIQFDAIVTYEDSKNADTLNLAISRIQALMVATEKRAILELAKSGRLSDGRYLVKDGSLEYMDDHLSEIKWKQLEGRLQYVIGVSKSFNPDLFNIRYRTETQSAAAFIASIPYGCRTQAFHYSVRRDSPPHFAVWYVRIRKPRLQKSAFDGILKVEMHLTSEAEVERGKESLVITRISEQLLREATPVCYGKDDRWANHIYPIYATECYLKSGFSPEMVLASITR